MTLNPEHQGHDQFDVLTGSVSHHFAKIESVLMQNECINGQYNLTSAASYGSNCPVKTPGFTRVCFSTNGPIVADLENSFIEADMEYTLQYSGWDRTKARLPKAENTDELLADGKTTPLTKVFIGFKQSLDALERYDLYCNSKLIYSQPFVGPESTITLAGLNDTIRENNPFVYTSFNNASTMDQNVCGVYVDLKDIPAGQAFKVKIPLKINLHQFLLLSPIHYLPSFAGRWELQLYFGSKNMVICPVNPSAYFVDNTVIGDWQQADKTLTVVPGFVGKMLDRITHTIEKHPDSTHRVSGWANYFTQINMPMPMYEGTVAADGLSKPVFKDLTLTHVSSSLETCTMNTCQFQLRYEVYQSLMQHYLANPLIIPTNTLAYQRFSHTTGPNDSNLTATANLPVENIDSVFILIPENDAQQTCYYQPYLDSVRLGLGEFGIRPARYMDTFNKGDDWNNRRFVSYLLDALNLESSQISAMNKDFSNSVLPHVTEYSGAPDANTRAVGRTNLHTVNNRMHKQYDNSHFIIGFPLSQVGFQSGTVTSPNCNINFQFDSHKQNIPVNGCTTREFSAGGIVAMFLQDCELVIQPTANSDHPTVMLSSKAIV